ncbi:hypothetical protein SPW_7455 [Streptomyces sp. W007]|nr:hypothetical protein SPW_7455 [Streptomyces sp. W007]
MPDQLGSWIQRLGRWAIGAGADRAVHLRGRHGRCASAGPAAERARGLRRGDMVLGAGEIGFVRENDFVCVFRDSDLPEAWNVDPLV